MCKCMFENQGSVTNHMYSIMETGSEAAVDGPAIDLSIRLQSELKKVIPMSCVQ